MHVRADRSPASGVSKIHVAATVAPSPSPSPTPSPSASPEATPQPSLVAQPVNPYTGANQGPAVAVTTNRPLPTRSATPSPPPLPSPLCTPPPLPLPSPLASPPPCL
jgi:hypothetical protein